MDCSNVLLFSIYDLLFSIYGFMKTFYITTPIYYANSLPHLWHLYTTTVVDAIIKHKNNADLILIS